MRGCDGRVVPGGGGEPGEEAVDTRIYAVLPCPRTSPGPGRAALYLTIVLATIGI